MTPYLGCEHARELLESFADGELPVADQVAVETHLRWCQTCRARIEDLRLIGSSLRLGSPVHWQVRDDEHALAAIQAHTLMRVRAEHDQSYGVLFREMFVDMRFLWPALGASLAVVICAAMVIGVLHRATQDRPESLASMIHLLANPGSDRNPLRLDNAMAIPRALDNGVTLEGLPDDEAVFTLSLVVGQDGRIANYELLEPPWPAVGHQRSAEHASHVEAVLDLVRQSRFAPALAPGGRVVAVNTVWLIAKTTAVAAAAPVPMWPMPSVIAPTLELRTPAVEAVDLPADQRSGTQPESPTA